MKYIAPAYYRDFKCIASACRHSCCVGWEIDVDAQRDEIYAKLKEKLSEKDGAVPALLDILTEAGYEQSKPVDIKWSFAYNEYGVMKKRADLGTEDIFGNFITLVRSNYEWEILLKNAVAVFAKLQAIYAEAQAANLELYQFFYGADSLVGSKWNARILGNYEISKRMKFFHLALELAKKIDEQ